MRIALERDQPDHLLICGYSTKESLAALDYANRHKRTAVLMCDSQEREFSTLLVEGGREAPPSATL